MSIQPLVLPVGAVGAGFGGDVLQMVVNAGLMVKFVMLILLLFSVVSWSIIFMKWRLFRKARAESDYFLERFWEGTEFGKLLNETADFGFSPIAQVFRAGYAEFRRVRKLHTTPSGSGEETIRPVLDQVERALRRSSTQQTSRMERTISFLATTGNTAPFIGLFGTVWGIMESFHGIGLRGSASLAVVAPGISEALIATAAGLAAAIPAVVAYNYFSRRVVVFTSEMETFASDLLSVIERQHLKQQASSRER
ncbi:MAG: protein TolQ [Deltaproteobacteria bacterium]|nr:protein TolQ [Deltaproteobacteria bacterium]